MAQLITENCIIRGIKQQHYVTGRQNMEGKYTECPNPQKSENHACDRQSGLNDSAPRNRIPVA